MIPAQELMIGNHVQHKGELLWVVKIMRATVNVTDGMFSHTYYFDTIDPIPITTEWLKRLGFEEYKGALRLEVTHGLYFGYFEQYTVNTIVFRNPAGHGSSIVLHHIHQLQNLYFALTGQQLNTMN